MMNEWIISSSVLIAAVLLGRWLLREKISLRLQYALWAVVLVRLLIPFQIFTSGFGTGSIAKEVDISQPVRQVYASATAGEFQAEYDAIYRRLETEYAAQSKPAAPDSLEKEAYTLASRQQALDLNRLLLHLWFAGMAAVTAVILSCNVHLSLRLKRRRWALEVPDSLLPVYITEMVPTPCVFGLFRPAIYLTPDAAKDPLVRNHVLAHELTHYRHFDHVWSVLRSLCLVLHWYNPLVWIAARVSRADAELACDEGALARLGESQRGDYGRTLIGLTCAAPISELFLTATTMTGSAGSIRERIRLLMKRPQNTVLTVTALILLVTLAVGCTFAGAPETVPPAESTHPSESVSDEPISSTPVTAEPITAYLAEADVQADCTYRAKETEYMTTIVFTTAEKLLDVEFGQLQWTDEDFFRMDMQYAIPALEAGQTLAVCVTFWGDTTTYGIRFTDGGGNERHFSVSLSGEDGSLILSEYIPDYYEQAFTIIYALPMEQAMEDYAERHPRALTDGELDAFRNAFATLDEDGNANPAACFLLPYYDDISEMDGSEFLAYFPTDQEGTKEEFELLKAKYPEFFEGWTWETMPIPIHRYSASEIDAVVSRYANIRWAELSQGVHYLEETGCYYNYTSDFGLGGFYAREGFVYDGGAVIYSGSSVLFFTETAGSYTIQAHLPLILAE